MNIIVAIDSFKESMDSLQAADAVREGILRAMPDAQIRVKPVADGGEGTVAALTAGMNGRLVELPVTGPLEEQVMARYGVVGTTAVIEMAMAAGLPLVPLESRNPLYTTTYGVGEMILDALDRGCRRFIVGIGGSATNDGGIGMLQALGFRFVGEDGTSVKGNASELELITDIDVTGADKRLVDCEFCIACDVTNPLCGEYGASHVFAPQKGADQETVRRLDLGLCHFADMTKRKQGMDCADVPGAGAAGGLGFAFMAYLNGKLQSGVDLILNTVLPDERLDWADVVITGEGKLDAQTAMGKAPYGIARRAKEHGCMVIALAGAIDGEGTDVFDARFCIQQAPVSLTEAMKTENAYRNMRDTAQQIFSLLSCHRA